MSQHSARFGDSGGRAWDDIAKLSRKNLEEKRATSQPEEGQKQERRYRRLIVSVLTVTCIIACFLIWQPGLEKIGLIDYFSGDFKGPRGEIGPSLLGGIEIEKDGFNSSLQGSDMPALGEANTPPSVAIVYPPDGSQFKVASSIELRASANDPDGGVTGVRFFEGNSLLCSSSSAPFSCTWNDAAAGAHEIHAQAYDDSGAGATSRGVVINITPIEIASGNISITFPKQESHLILDSQTGATTVFFKGSLLQAEDAASLQATITDGTCTIEPQQEFSGACSISEPGVHVLRVVSSSTKGEASVITRNIVATRAVPVDLRATNPYYSPDDLAEIVRDWGSPPPAWSDSDPALSSLLPIPAGSRLAPTFEERPTMPSIATFGRMATLDAAGTAGSFDDYFARSNTTVPLPSSLSWRAPNGDMLFEAQGKIFTLSEEGVITPHYDRRSKYNSATLATRGISFVSRFGGTDGHSIFMSPVDRNVSLERNDFFLNTLPIIAAGRSYGDTLPALISDSFDGIFTHYFSTIGEGPDELNAIIKLMIAGSQLPPETKRLLKSTGNYAPILQWLWRAALPYADASGKPLPFTHELRHRSAYNARGDSTSSQSISTNQSYQMYDEALHVREMARLARTFKGKLPPVTIMSLVKFSVEGGVERLSKPTPWDVGKERITLMLPTVARVRARAGERIIMRIDLGGSYDLYGRSLSYAVEPLYPEHRSLLTIRKERNSHFVITASYNPRFPSARIPVIVTARNDDFVGTPAFINFSWGDASYGATPESDSRDFINHNSKPTVASPTAIPVNTTVGSVVEIPLSCSDPEQFPTTWLRWSNEPGTIANGVYTYRVTPEYEGKEILLHFICSDGTGSYNSLEHRISVGRSGAIQGDYRLLDQGSVTEPSVGSVTAGGLFRLIAGGEGVSLSHQGNSGSFSSSFGLLYRPTDGDFDILAKVASFAPFSSEQAPSFGMLVQSSLSLGQGSHVCAVGSFALRTGSSKGVVSARCTDADGNEQMFSATPQASPGMNTFRVMRRGSVISLLAQDSSGLWEQVAAVQHELPQSAFAGFFLSANLPASSQAAHGTASASGTLVTTPTQSSLPIILIAPSTNTPGAASVSILPPSASDQVTFSVSGAVQISSQTYSHPFTLQGNGAVEIKAFRNDAGEPSSTVVARLILR